MPSLSALVAFALSTVVSLTSIFSIISLILIGSVLLSGAVVTDPIEMTRYDSRKNRKADQKETSRQ